MERIPSDQIRIKSQLRVKESLIMLAATEQLLLEQFGPCHDLTSDHETENSHFSYWAFKTSCGLELFIKFHPEKDQVEIYAHQAEIDHILRHLKLPTAVLWRLDQAHPDIYKNLVPAEPEWALWRQDDHGNKVKIGLYFSEREAFCLRTEFESHGHRQIYWVERTD